MWIVSQFFFLELLTVMNEARASEPATGILGAVYVGLYQVPTPILTPQSTLAAITEATYDGYARQEVVWYPAYMASGGVPTLEGASLHFSPTGSVVGNVITGVFIADALTNGNLLMSKAWPGLGAGMGSPSQALTVDAFWQFPFGQNYGSPELTN